MRKIFVSFAVTLMLIALGLTPAICYASGADSKEIVVKGELIDHACFVGKDGARGAAHKDCAVTCAKGGGQLAIVDDKGKVYLISGDYAANKNEKLIPFVAEHVEAKGQVTEKDGKMVLEVKEIKKAISQEIMVKGELIDHACFVGKDGARGAKHKDCAVTCAKGGGQLAIVDDKGKVYLISGDYAANKNEKLIPLVAEHVEAKGQVTEKDGKMMLEVKEIKKAEMKH